MIDKMADIKVHNHNHLPKNNDIDKLARKMATLQKANKI
jgi:ribonuclease HI